MKRFLTATCSVLLLVVPSAVAAQDAPQVVIGEIAWAGSSRNAADEWLELINVSTEAVDLSGWTIEGAGTSGSALELPPDSLIAPFATFLISNYGPDDANSVLDAAADLVTTRLSLSNASLALVLRDAAGNERDRAGSGGAPFTGRAAGAGGSPGGGAVPMVRRDPALRGDDPAAWADAVHQVGMDAGVPDLGTPGTPDLVLVETAEEETPVLEDPPAEEPEPTQEEPEPSVEETDIAEESTEPELVEEPSLVETHQNFLPSTHPPGTLIVSELYPNPDDSEEEFVEVYNPHNNVIDLAGWSVADASGKATPLPDQLLGYMQYALVRAPKGKLNNDTDAVFLFSPTGAVIDQVAYLASLKVKKGESLIREGDALVRTTTVTPGYANVLTPPAVAKAPTPNTTPAPAVPTAAAATPTAVPPPPEATDETATEPELVPQDYSGLRLSELYPQTGADATEEFIEIENTGTTPILLRGLSVADASGKAYAITDAVELAPGGLLLLMRPMTGIALNNDADTLRLLAPDGSVLDAITYDKTRKGYALARIDDAWAWTPGPTPGARNALAPTVAVVAAAPAPAVAAVTVKAPAPPAVAKAKSSAKVPPVHRSMTIGEALVLKDGTRVRLEGKVVLPPKADGSQTMEIEDASGKIQVYRYAGLDGTLRIGDLVRVEGELSTAGGKRRIKLTALPAVTGHEDPPAAAAATEPVAPPGAKSAKDASRETDALVGSLLVLSAAAFAGFRFIRHRLANRYASHPHLGLGAQDAS